MPGMGERINSPRRVDSEVSTTPTACCSGVVVAIVTIGLKSAFARRTLTETCSSVSSTSARSRLSMISQICSINVRLDFFSAISYNLSIYSPVRVSILTTVSLSTKRGTCIVKPVSKVAGLVLPLTVSPLTPGSVSTI